MRLRAQEVPAGRRWGAGRAAPVRMQMRMQIPMETARRGGGGFAPGMEGRAPGGGAGRAPRRSRQRYMGGPRCRSVSSAAVSTGRLRLRWRGSCFTSAASPTTSAIPTQSRQRPWRCPCPSCAVTFVRSGRPYVGKIPYAREAPPGTSLRLVQCRSTRHFNFAQPLANSPGVLLSMLTAVSTPPQVVRLSGTPENPEVLGHLPAEVAKHLAGEWRQGGGGSLPFPALVQSDAGCSPGVFLCFQAPRSDSALFIHTYMHLTGSAPNLPLLPAAFAPSSLSP